MHRQACTGHSAVPQETGDSHIYDEENHDAHQEDTRATFAPQCPAKTTFLADGPIWHKDPSSFKLTLKLLEK